MSYSMMLTYYLYAALSNGFCGIPANTPEDIHDKLLQVVTERIPKRFGLHPVKDVQVLSGIPPWSFLWRAGFAFSGFSELEPPHQPLQVLGIVVQLSRSPGGFASSPRRLLHHLRNLNHIAADLLAARIAANKADKVTG